MNPKSAILICAVAALLSAAPNGGVPARPAPSDYPASTPGTSATVAADAMGPDQVKGAFSTDLTEYLVVEVALYPKDGKTLDVSSLDFSLKFDGRNVRPVDPHAIATIRHNRANKKGSDVALYPTVGVSTGTWGTGAGVGVGVGRAPQRAPASTRQDRDVMEQELSDKALVDGKTEKPVAGFLYFPVGKKKASSYELEYQAGDTTAKLTLTAK